MAVLNITELRELKSFFKVLNTFRKNPSATFASVAVDGVKTTVVKSQALQLLRSKFSSLSGEEFKDDNFLINYLSKQRNQDEILSELPKTQWEELSQQSATTTETQESSGQIATQPTGVEISHTPTGESASTMAGGIPSLPSAGSVSQSPRIRIVQTPPTPATDKAERFAQENPATAKAMRIRAETKAMTAQPGPATAKMERFQVAAANPGLRFKPGFGNTLRNFGSKAGTFFQRNVGKYLTVGRAATGIGAVIGGFAGAGLTGGSSLGVFGGAIGGGVLPSWFKSGGGGRFFGNLGNGAVNAFSRLSNQISGPRFLQGVSKKLTWAPWAFLGMFLLFALGAGVIGGLIGGGGTPSGESGNVGIGTTAPQPAPITTSPGSVPTEKLAQILHWAGIINSTLEPGLPPSSFNRMVQNITNGTYTATIRTAEDRGVGPTGIYWCTNIVIDSYNLSGISGLGPGHQEVKSMMQFWQSGVSNYTFIPYNGTDSLRQVKPGYAFFRIYPSDYRYDHVSIIKSISPIDHRGNGSIITLDSNTYKEWSSTIEDGQFINNYTYFKADIVGFGGVQ